MSNRAIKDSIWTSPTLAKIDFKYQSQFPWWLLLADDWGCFNVNSKVIKGTAYPMCSIGVDYIDEVKEAFQEVGLLFIWVVDEREWGYFVSWDNHHSFCGKTSTDGDGSRTKHKRKTPIPPEKELKKYLDRYNE